jgi:hypothetical protein
VINQQMLNIDTKYLYMVQTQSTPIENINYMRYDNSYCSIEKRLDERYL